MPLRPLQASPVRPTIPCSGTDGSHIPRSPRVCRLLLTQGRSLGTGLESQLDIPASHASGHGLQLLATAVQVSYAGMIFSLMVAGEGVGRATFNWCQSSLLVPRNCATNTASRHAVINAISFCMYEALRR